MKIPLTFKRALKAVKANLEVGITPALLGEAGIGKSSFVEDLAREFKTRVYTLPVNQLADRSDLTGVRAVEIEGVWQQISFPHSIIAEAIEYAKENPDENPILFLDEFNRASAEITSSVLSLHTLRRIGSVDLPDNLRLIVAGNDSGNIVGVDEASISRFVLYKIIPDTETFLQLEQLNPFVQEVLTEQPDLLMAKSVEIGADTGDEDDEDDNPFSELEFMSGDSFEQVTRPRTITALSRWMDSMGIDKSGSKEERETLVEFMSIPAGEEYSTMYAVAIAHVGHTQFTVNLMGKLQAYFSAMMTSGTTQNNAKPKLQALRPRQDVINVLSRANTKETVEDLISNQMTKDEVRKTMVWLVEQRNVTEINNNHAVVTFMEEAPHLVDNLEPAEIQNLLLVLPHPKEVARQSMQIILDSGAQWVGTYKAVFETTMSE